MCSVRQLSHGRRDPFLFFHFAGDTRVISQTALDHFRTSLQTEQHDPYAVLLRRNKPHMQLLDDAANPNPRFILVGPNTPCVFEQNHAQRCHIFETKPFATFSAPKAQRN